MRAPRIVLGAYGESVKANCELPATSTLDHVPSALPTVNAISLGRYQLQKLIDQGGMGEVYQTCDTRTDRVDALGALPPHLAEDETFQRRFRREPQAAAGVNDRMWCRSTATSVCGHAAQRRAQPNTGPRGCSASATRRRGAGPPIAVATCQGRWRGGWPRPRWSGCGRSVSLSLRRP